MRKLLLLSFLALLTAGAAGCARNRCGRQNYAPVRQDCCDPCGGGMSAGFAPGPAMIPGPAPAMAAPCCQ